MIRLLLMRQIIINCFFTNKFLQTLVTSFKAKFQMPRPSIAKVALVSDPSENITVFAGNQMSTNCALTICSQHLFYNRSFSFASSKTPARPSPKRTAEERSCQSNNFEVFLTADHNASLHSRTHKIFSCRQHRQTPHKRLQYRRPLLV